MSSKLFPKIFHTIVILFIVLFCTSVLVAILLPARHNIGNAERLRLMSDAKHIYTCIFAELTDPSSEFNSTVLYPQNKNISDQHFKNSTDYFKFLITNDILPGDWFQFAGRGIQPATGIYDPKETESIESFKPENNAWSVVTDLNIEKSEASAPFLITRNLQEPHLKSTTEKPIIKGPPYEDEALVIIRINGAGEILKKRNINWENINPTGLDNKILHP